MTFAIIQTGGKQYKVKKGDIITIERLGGEFKEGDKVVFDEIVMVGDDKKVDMGEPFMTGAKVEAKFIGEFKDKKVTSLRFKNKTNQNMGVKRGHRQILNKVEIVKL